MKTKAIVTIAAVSLIALLAGYLYTALREKPKTLSLGESIRGGEDLLITFTGTEFTREVIVDLQFSVHAPKGHIFFLINVTLENIGKVDQSYARSNLYIDSDKYFPDAILVTDSEEFEIRDCAFSIYEIKAGETIDTYIFFEIPENLTPNELHSSLYEKEVEWILKLNGLAEG